MNKLFYILILFLITQNFSLAMQDDFVMQTLSNKELIKPQTHTIYNYESTEKIPLIITATEKITSEENISEGNIISFKVCEDVIYQGDIHIAKGTILTGKIETTIPSGMNGIPASIIIGNFDIPNINPDKVTYYYEIIGQDRSLWVYPLKWALTILPPTGSLTNFIFGGHAKLSTKKKIKLYYYPEWI